MRCARGVALLIPSAVWASGADTTITSVKKFDNSTLNSSYIRLVYGSTVNYDAVWNFSQSTFGFGPGTGDNIAVKATAWDSDTPATSPDPNKHYGFLSGTTSGAGELPSTITGSISAIYRAYMPFDPQITAVSEVKTTNLLNNEVSGNLTITGRQQLPGTGENAQISTYHWRYRIDSGNPVDVATGGNLVLNDAQGPATYYISLALENEWGKTPYSPEVSYAFGGAAGPGGPLAFNLDAIATDKLVINTVYLQSTASAATAVALADLVNTAAGGNVTRAICAWDNTTGQPVVALFDDAGALTGGTADFNLSGGKAYQIYTTTAVTITL